MSHARPAFTDLWGRSGTLVFEVRRCEAADTFRQWTEQLCTAAEDRRAAVAINQAKVLLLDRYFAFTTTVDVAHLSESMGLDADHDCLYQVFVAAYDRLRRAELTLQPPRLDPDIVEVTIREQPAAARNPLDGVIFGSYERDAEFG